ncbi:MAG: hypothetical protein HDR05_08865 [Lachnospiraceae bacterium]|nr:hypothetical protein [Lachnospiraceae bacterium]
MKRTVIAVGLILLSVAGLCGCGAKHELTELTTDSPEGQQLYTPVEDETFPPADTASSEDENSGSPQLTALADTLEDAQEIADLYGIELVSYSYGVAVYHTDKDISELIQLGLDNDYPTLAPDTEIYLHTEQ